MLQIYSIKELEQQFGGSNKRNKPDKSEIESVLTPYINGVSNVYITPDGKIISENSDELKQLKINNPQFVESLLILRSPSNKSQD